jgi:hypothetical protein
MLTVQLGVPVEEAFAQLRAYAYSQERRLADVASDMSPGACGCLRTRNRYRTAGRDSPAFRARRGWPALLLTPTRG